MIEQETLYLQIHVALMSLANYRREPVDSQMLKGILKNTTATTPESLLEDIAAKFGWPTPTWLSSIDEARCPCFYYDDDGIGVVTGRSPEGKWALTRVNPETKQPEEQFFDNPPHNARTARLKMRVPFVARKSPTTRLVVSELLSQKRYLTEIFASSLAVGVLAVFVSFYAMQVYDRVIPKSGMQQVGYSTLLTLTIGVLFAVFLELLGKWKRADQLHYLIDLIDQRLARSTYSRLLGIRLDALPPSVGAAAQRVRSYETIRSFLVTLTTHLIIDLPISLLMLLVIWLIAGYVVIIPLTFFILGLLLATYFRKRIEHWTRKAQPSHHLKTGILVETIEGSEVIKSGNGGWRMLSRWLDVTDRAREFDLTIQQTTERSQFLLASAQQFSFVLIIASGAVMAIAGNLTMGQLLACSILSGRAMTPLAAIPRMLVQWGQTKIGVEDIDRMWRLDQDYNEGEQPIFVEQIKGSYKISNLAAYYTNFPALKIENAEIKAGEKIAVIGPVGSGKTTLLRILSGMYKPREGRITLDDIELCLHDKAILSTQIGFVPQDGRLFSGTLRDNLVLGMEDPGDSVIMEAAEKTGLLGNVISDDPKGLERLIQEGGSGLSGGQKQLVHLTRVFLRKPKIWLLDEPTASMDATLEKKLLQAFAKELQDRPDTTFVVVTHKPIVLNIVDKIIVMANHSIALSGPKKDVLDQLKNPAPSAQTQNVQATISPTVTIQKAPSIRT